MGHIDVQRVSFSLPDGRPLLDDVSFRVGEGVVAALVGANGVAKTKSIAPQFQSGTTMLQTKAVSQSAATTIQAIRPATVRPRFIPSSLQLQRKRRCA